jgi:hypothetical protein
VPKNKPRFICEVCEAEVPLEAKSCPSCGQLFAATLCPACGFSGEGSLFENGCPACGYILDAEKTQPASVTPPSIAPKETAITESPPLKQAWYSHFSYYVLALAIFVALAAAVIFSFFI